MRGRMRWSFDPPDGDIMQYFISLLERPRVCLRGRLAFRWGESYVIFLNSIIKQ